MEVVLTVYRSEGTGIDRACKLSNQLHRSAGNEVRVEDRDREQNACLHEKKMPVMISVIRQERDTHQTVSFIYAVRYSSSEQQSQSPTDLVEDEQESSQSLGRSLSVVQRHDGAHGSDTKSSNKSSHSKLSNRPLRSGLDGNSDGEDDRPDKDRPFLEDRKKVTVGAELKGKRV